ncbi:hypothetical protein GQX74_005686, partial [Glossina fuscipes]
PIVSPESNLRNLERSPLFILRKKPKRNYIREFREKAKLALLYEPTPETLVPSNQFNTEISNHYDLDEDDYDIFASVSTQEILHQDVKINNFPHMSKFPDFKKLTENGRSWEKTKTQLESEEVKSKVNRDEVGKVNNPGSSLVTAGLEDMRNRKKHLLSLNPKFNYRPPQLCETPNRNSRQTETTELGGFVKNDVETSTPGVNRKLPVQEMEKDNDAIPTANRPKRWRLSDLRRTGISRKK